MWGKIWAEYVKDWQNHPPELLVMQVISIILILFLGMVAIRFVGKKSLNQLTLPNVLFVFVLSSTLGALITKPVRIFVALLVVLTIIAFMWLIEKLQLKFNSFEKIVIGYPAILYHNGQYQKLVLSSNKITVDQLESIIRSKGYPSIEVCKTVIIESNGNISVELLPEYEPVRKLYFDKAMKDILEALETKYVEAKPPEMNNLFQEVLQGKNQQNNGELE